MRAIAVNNVTCAVFIALSVVIACDDQFKFLSASCWVEREYFLKHLGFKLHANGPGRVCRRP